MERTSRLLVLVSLALAGVSHVLLIDHVGIRTAAGVAFAAMFVAARLSLPIALVAVMSTTFVAPALTDIFIDGGDHHQIVVWLAGAAGLIIARANPRAWSVPPSWTLPLAMWASVIAVTWPLVVAREVDFSLVAARAVLPATPLTQAPPAVVAAFVALTALTQLSGILWLDFLWSTFKQRTAEFSRFVVLPLIASGVAGSLAAVYQRTVDPTWMNLHIWSNLQRAGGLMHDANAFGTAAALLAPLAIALAWVIGRGMIAAGVATAVLAAGMWSTGSRTALVVFSIGAGAVVVAVLRQRGAWNPRIAGITAAALVAVFLLAAAMVPRDYESSNPLERAFARVPRLEQTEIGRFANELWIRFGYGTAARQMLAEHPIAGVGVGAFHVLSPEYIYRNTGRVVPADNAQNWWRHQLAELGVLGGAPAVWFSVIVATLCLRRTSDPTATVLRGVIIGLGIVSLLGVPTQHPALTFSAATVLIWLAIAAELATTTRVAPVGRGRHAAIVILVAVVAGTLAWQSTATLRPPHRAAIACISYAHGLAPAQEISRFGELQWMATRAVVVLPVSGPWLRFTIVAPYGDLDRRPLTVHLRATGAAPVTRRISDTAPTSLFVEAPRAAMMMVELEASRELLPDRALQLAQGWHDRLPADVADDHVARLVPAEQ